MYKFVVPLKQGAPTGSKNTPHDTPWALALMLSGSQWFSSRKPLARTYADRTVNVRSLSLGFPVGNLTGFMWNDKIKFGGT